MSFSRGSYGRENLDINQIDWPRHMPAFRPGRSVVTPEGNLWVERWGSIGQPVTIDIFDARGEKSGEVEIPAQRRVVGFGDEVVYLIFTDEYGLNWLERYRLL